MSSTNRLTQLLGGLGLWAIAAGCGSDLPKAYLVDNLRVLGVQAEPPEAAPGTTVALSALVLQPDAAAATEYAWAACVISVGQPASGCALPTPGVLPPSCADAPDAPLCVIGTDPDETYVPPQRALDGRPAGEPGVVVITLLAAATADGGVTACAVALEDPATAPLSCRAAVKRLAVLPAGAPAANANPGLGDFSIDGAATVATLTLALADGAAEPVEGGNEALFLSWFVTGGELDKFRTDGDPFGLENKWTLPDAPGHYQAAVVVRDGRGGESWKTLEIDVP